MSPWINRYTVTYIIADEHAILHTFQKQGFMYINSKNIFYEKYNMSNWIRRKYRNRIILNIHAQGNIAVIDIGNSKLTDFCFIYLSLTVKGKFVKKIKHVENAIVFL